MPDYHFQRVKRGDFISADWANALVDRITNLDEKIRRLETQLNIELASRLDAVVELVQDLHMGGSAKAKVLWREKTFGFWTEAPTAEITVYDAIGNIEATVGDRFIARFFKQPGIWLVIGATGQGGGGSPATSSVTDAGTAHIITFALTEELSALDPSGTGEIIGFYGPTGPPRIEVELLNPPTMAKGEYRYSGPAGAMGEAWPVGEGDDFTTYVIINLECP